MHENKSKNNGITITQIRKLDVRTKDIYIYYIDNTIFAYDGVVLSKWIYKGKKYSVQEVTLDKFIDINVADSTLFVMNDVPEIIRHYHYKVMYILLCFTMFDLSLYGSVYSDFNVREANYILNNQSIETIYQAVSAEVRRRFDSFKDYSDLDLDFDICLDLDT
jgi:hypothetical protein